MLLANIFEKFKINKNKFILIFPGEYLHPRTLAQYQYDRSDEDYPMTNERQRWHSASPKVFSSNASTVSLPASAVLGGGVGGSRGRSVTPTAPLASVAAAPVTVNNSDLAAGHKRSHSVGAGNRGASPSSGGHRNHSLERLVACEEQLEERRRKVKNNYFLLFLKNLLKFHSMMV